MGEDSGENLQPTSPETEKVDIGPVEAKPNLGTGPNSPSAEDQIKINGALKKLYEKQLKDIVRADLIAQGKAATDEDVERTQKANVVSPTELAKYKADYDARQNSLGSKIGRKLPKWVKDVYGAFTGN